MRYILPLDQPYSQLCHIVKDTAMRFEFDKFSTIMVEYINMCIIKWHLGIDRVMYLESIVQRFSRYLTVDECVRFIDYLDTVYWPYVNSSITEDIGYDSVVDVKVNPDASLDITITQLPQIKIKTPLQIAIDNVCIEVETKLYSGEYIDPKLKEIYDARQATYN